MIERKIPRCHHSCALHPTISGMRAIKTILSESRYNPNVYRMLKEIKERRELGSDAQALKFCISLVHSILVGSTEWSTGDALSVEKRRMVETHLMVY